jgi:acyl-CoA synthetase (AMP-forming)/AMP-acid ligase II
MAGGLRGEAVAIASSRPRSFVVALVGCLYAGAVAVPLPSVVNRRAAGRISAILKAAQPKAILGPGDLLRQEWVADATRASSTDKLELETLLSASDGAEVGPFNDPAAAALVQFTSGSTSEPRGICLTHANLVANCSAIESAFGLDSQSRGMSWLPLHHDMGLVGHVLTPLWVGGLSCLLDPLVFMQSPLRWLRAVSEEATTITSAPTFAYEMCARAAAGDDLSGIDLSRLTTAICGGEPIWPETISRFCAAFSAAGFSPGAFAPSYGLAEATLLVATGKRKPGPAVFDGEVRDSSGSRSRARAVKLGPAVAGNRVIIAHPTDGTEVPEGHIGEVVVSGASVGRLYGDPATTAGSARTGDLGFLLAGELHLTGRLKELIIVRGQNIYPSDVEAAIAGADERIVPGGVAAIGVETGGTQSLAVLFEVRARLERADERARLCARINEAVARATGHVPDQALPLLPGALPRTSSGKVMRLQAKAMLLDGRLSAGRPLVRQEIRP